jgi:hypothetical protein
VPMTTTFLAMMIQSLMIAAISVAA